MAEKPDEEEIPTTPGDPNEEQLDIAGGESHAPVDDQSDDSIDESVNHMETSIPNLAGLTTPGESVDDFLDKLLDTPAEKLIPWEDCHIPSKGLYYDGWPDGVVRVRAMGQTAEKILATQRLAQSGQSIYYLFRECCKFAEGFDPVNLLLGDRVFLLYFLRGITHGNIYEFAFTCPNSECESITTHKYDLNELAGTIVWANEGMGNEPFKVHLPYMSEATGRDVWVSVRFLRAYDATDILARRKVKSTASVKPGGVRTNKKGRPTRHGSSQAAKNKKQNQQLDDSITDNLEKVIVNVMGSNDPFKIRQLVAKLHAKDTATIREWLRNNTPGIDNTVLVGCPECGMEHTVELPITESFFRPSNS
jgi:hypothetical protein